MQNDPRTTPPATGETATDGPPSKSAIRTVAAAHGLPGAMQNLRRRWQDLPLGSKMRISLIAVLFVAVVLIVAAAQVAIQISAFNTARLSQQAQIDEAAKSFSDALALEQRTLNTFVSEITPAIADYLQASIDNAQESQADYQLIRLNTAILSRMIAQRDLLYEVRFLDVNGLQKVRVVRDLRTGIFNVTAVQALESEAAQPYFGQLRQLAANTLYLSRVSAVRGADVRSAETVFEFGETLVQEGRVIGTLMMSVTVTEPLNLIIGNLARGVDSGITLIDDKRQILASNLAGRRYIYDGNTFEFDDPLPSAVFGTENVEFLLDNTVYPGGNAVPQSINTRVLPIRTVDGNANWRILLTQTTESILAPTEPIRAAVLLPVLIAFGLVSLLTNFIARTLTRPITQVTQAAQRIAGGDLHIALRVDGKDEISVMNQSLNAMALQTLTLIDTLESRVSARTRDIEATAEISRDLSGVRDVGDLLNRAVGMLRDRFGFYHVQIFLLDDRREFAILKASTGEIGRQLLERNHKLAVGSFSIIGQVTEKERPFVTLDTRNSEVPHRFNPLLPNTRSEMALPLRVAEDVIGALDVQSEKADVFDANTVRVFQVLADQIAALIENTRLLKTSSESIEQVAALNRQLTRSAWDEYKQEHPLTTGFAYNRMDVRADGPDTQLDRQPDSAESSADIRVRGETIGVLSAAGMDGKPLNDADRQLMQAVAERVAIVIDNVRQTERTQTALDEIERLYLTSRELSAAPDVAAVYVIAATQMSRFDQVSEVGLWRAGPAEAATPEWLIYAHTWNRKRGTGPLANLPPDRMPHPIADMPMLEVLVGQTTPLYIRDVEEIKDAGGTYDFFREAGATSMALFPLRTANRWLGLLIAMAAIPNAFSEAFLRFGASLSDQVATALENRQLFAESQRARETLQSILDSLPAGVIVVDGQTRQITLTNAQAIAFLGLDTHGKPQTGALLPPTADPRSPNFAPLYVLETGAPLIGQDVQIERMSGDRHSYLVNAVPILGADGAIRAAVAVFTDTTNLRELELALQDNLLETSALYQASRLIAEQEDIIQIIRAAISQTQSFLEADQIFFVFQDEARTITAVYGINDKEENQVWMLDSNPPVLYGILNEENETIIADTTEAQVDTTFRSVAAFPMKARNRTVGWMVLGFSEQHALTMDERRFFNSLADQIASAAESARLAQQTADALREAEFLYRASRAVTAAATVFDAAQALKEQLLRLKPDRVDIFVLAARDQLERIDWTVRYEAAPPSSRSTLLLEGSYISDAELLLYEPSFVADRARATEAQRDLIGRVPNADEIMAQISVPLRVKSNTLGRVVISFFAPRRFTPAEEQFVVTVIDQTSTVIDNVMLFQESQDTLQETSTLYQAGRAIADAVDNDGVLNAIVDHALVPQVTRVLLMTLYGNDWEDAEALIEVSAEWATDTDMPLYGLRVTAGQFPIWQEIATPDILYVDNVEESPVLTDDSRVGFISFGMMAFVIVPLVTAGKPVGALLLGSELPREHSARELRLYSNLADQAAIAIENRTLLQQSEARGRQLSASVEVGRAATSTLNLNELLDRTVDLVRESFNYDHVQIFLIGADGIDAQLKASTGEAGRQLLANRHSLPVGSASVIGRVTGGGQAYNVIDTADSRQIHRPNIYLPNTRSELAIPLIARGKIIGALDVQSNEPGTFRPEDQKVLGTLADQVAVAIDNARLFELSTRRLEEVRFLFNVTRTAAAVEIDVALSKVTREVLGQTDSDLTVLMLLDEEKKRLIVNYSAREGARYVVPVSVPVETPLIAQIRQSYLPILMNAGAEAKLFLAEDVPGLQSMLVVPLLGSDELLGVLVTASERRDAFTADTTELLQTLTSTLTAIVQNARLLAEVQEANQRLREVDKLKSQFLANMSHELRTPLNSIIGFSRVILKGIDGPLNDTQTQDLTTIHESGRHLLNLVNDILDQAKIEAGKMELALDYFKVEEMIKTVMSTASGLVKDKPIRLHQEVQPGLPEVYVDDFRTRQVLLNILSNASKFTRQGSITVTAFKVEEAGQPLVQITVTDTGIGISKDNVRRVFAQFEQVDNSTARGAEGTGLGMPIAKSLIEMMGGRIWLESEVNVGSTFSITLPTQPTENSTGNVPIDENGAEPDPISEAVTLPTELEAQVAQAITHAGTPRPLQRIVVAIDDEAGMINMYRRYLVKAGFEVIGTTNPEEAADLIVNYQPAVILLDVNMPRRNGWEVLEALKDHDETFAYPVIVCSIEADKTRAFRLGAADYLVKPFLEEDLLGTIRRVQLERDLPGVLLVDTNEETLHQTSAALTSKDDVLRLIQARSTEQALDMVVNHRPNLVILDLRSNGLDAIQTVKHIRKTPETSSTRILIVPGPDISPDELIALDAHNVQFETGFTVGMVLQIVRTQLGLNGTFRRTGAD